MNPLPDAETPEDRSTMSIWSLRGNRNAREGRHDHELLALSSMWRSPSRSSGERWLGLTRWTVFARSVRVTDRRIGRALAQRATPRSAITSSASVVVVVSEGDFALTRV